MKKKILLIMILVLSIAVIIIYGMILKYNKTEIKEEIYEKQEIKLEEVKSANAYFTVQSCINKYLRYVRNNDIESILKILDYRYIEQKNINKDNITNKIEMFKGMIDFKAQKMKVEEINEGISKYYVIGVIEELDPESEQREILEENKIIKENYCISVILDFNNMTYSVIPLEDGGVFDEKTN